jgi:hypothetical protein
MTKHYMQGNIKTKESRLYWKELSKFRIAVLVVFICRNLKWNPSYWTFGWKLIVVLLSSSHFFIVLFFHENDEAEYHHQQQQNNNNNNDNKTLSSSSSFPSFLWYFIPFSDQVLPIAGFRDSWFSGAFAKVRKATISLVMSVHLSVRMEQLGSH